MSGADRASGAVSPGAGGVELVAPARSSAGLFDLRSLLLFGAGLFLAFPDWVPVNAGMGLQLSMICAMALLAAALLGNGAVPTTPGAAALLALVFALAFSVFPLVAHGGGLWIGPPRVGKWATQTGLFAAMALCALGLWMHVHHRPDRARWLHGGVAAAALVTIVSGAAFLLLHAAGVTLQLPHNNSSFATGVEWWPAVNTREGSGPPRLYGFFREPSFLSVFVAPLAIYFGTLALLRQRGRRWRSAWLAAGAAGALLATGGRTGQLALVLSIPLVWLSMRRHALLAQLYVTAAIVVVPIGFLAVTVLAPGAFEAMDASVIQRSAASIIGLRMFAAHPWFGVGYGNFGHAYPDFLALFAAEPALYTVLADQYVNGVGLPPAYNVAVRFLAEVGLVGFGALALLACVTLRRAITSGCAAATAAALALCCFLIGGVDSFALFHFWVFLVLAQPEVHRAAAAVAVARPSVTP